MWRSGWTLVPSKEVERALDENKADDIEIWDYPWVGFADGEVEGTDLNKLWLLIDEPVRAETPIWDTMLRDAPHGCEKVATVRPSAIEAFAAVSERRIAELATAWQKVESMTGSLAWWKVEDIIQAIREMKFLARQQLKLRPGWELLMVWFV